MQSRKSNFPMDEDSFFETELKQKAIRRRRTVAAHNRRHAAIAALELKVKACTTAHRRSGGRKQLVAVTNRFFRRLTRLRRRVA